MKVDFGKSYRGVSGKRIAECMVVISSFTRGMARGGYGAWARRALQAAELIPAKAYMTTLGDFVAVCRKVDSGAIVKIHSAADIKYNSSEAADKGEKSSVARARDGMKALDVEAFKVLAESVDTLIRAGFTTVEYWLEQPDGGEVARVDSLANVINDTFYRGVTNAMRANAITARGIGNGKSAITKKETVNA
jgi:hypothetical protein